MTAASATFYRLDELAKIATELGLVNRRVDADRLAVDVVEGAVLEFWNMREENDTLVGFEGTPWHAHGRVMFGTGGRSYVEYDELELLIALGTGALLIVTEYAGGVLRDRRLHHAQEPLELEHMAAGDELRVLRLRETPAAPAAP